VLLCSCCDVHLCLFFCCSLGCASALATFTVFSGICARKSHNQYATSHTHNSNAEIVFKSFRVPRSALLARFGGVDDTGAYVPRLPGRFNQAIKQFTL
jgi:hypothetical protein